MQSFPHALLSRTCMSGGLTKHWNFVFGSFKNLGFVKTVHVVAVSTGSWRASFVGRRSQAEDHCKGPRATNQIRRRPSGSVRRRGCMHWRPHRWTDGINVGYWCWAGSVQCDSCCVVDNTFNPSVHRCVWTLGACIDDHIEEQME